jgi:hypothetical protein
VQSPGLKNRLIWREQVLPLLMRPIVGVNDWVGYSALSVRRHDHQLSLLILGQRTYRSSFSSIVSLVG